MSAQTDGVTQKKFLMTRLGRRSVRLHVHSSPHLKTKKADENRAPVKSKGCVCLASTILSGQRQP